MSKLKKFLSSSNFKQLDAGLESSKKSFFSRLTQTIAGRSTVDADLLDELEEVLIASDIGVQTTLKIIDHLEERVAEKKYLNSADLAMHLKQVLLEILVTPPSEEKESTTPKVFMIVGVNGVGKTTTVGKLAHRFSQEGKKVVLGAADTFRAGAIDQLQIWADRTGVTLVKQQMGSDPASVAFDTMQSGVAQNADVILIDTAGRLHNKTNLMQELSKIKRVMAKVVPEAPHEVLLVLDGSTGQNAFEQAKQFAAATDITALAITKLDGTAKGGVVLGISDQFQIPVKYIGVGEGVTDLQAFDPETFITTFFS
ncbi:MAG: signal recognition particle-docking protein FtsY [Flavobacteriaceae bacterium]